MFVPSIIKILKSVVRPESGNDWGGIYCELPKWLAKKRKRTPKLTTIKIDREEICYLNKDGLPDDLISKGHEPVVVQNIIIKSDNVRYLREAYYSPSTHKTYLSDLPPSPLFNKEGLGEILLDKSPSALALLSPFFKGGGEYLRFNHY